VQEGRHVQEVLMRENKPFGIPGLEGPMKIGDHFLQIDATGRLLGEGDRLIKEFSFIFDPEAKRFVGVKGWFLPLPTHFKWKEVKEIEILIDLSYEIWIPRSLKVGSGAYKLSQRWYVDYGKKGTALQTGPLKDLGSKGKGDFAVHVAIDTFQPPVEADWNSVTLVLRLTAGMSDEGITIGVGPVSGNVGGSSGIRKMDYEFRLNYLVTDRPEEPVPLPEDLLSQDVWFEKEDQEQISVDELRRLEKEWSDPLRSRAPELAAAIHGGTVRIKLTGHASATGKSKDYNRALSRKRITSVADAIKTTFKSQKINYDPLPLGQDVATQKGPAPQERRVEIEIDREGAKAALSSAQRSR
jgi:hypothetical protein